MERDLETEALDRLGRAGSREDLELADDINSIKMPWVFGGMDEENIRNDLDKLLEEDV